jgi:amino-acid N-acetyltransferase
VTAPRPVPPPQVVTRRATRADAPAIVALINLYVESGTLLPRSLEFVAERAHDFIVAVDRGRITGCVHLDEYAPSLAEVRSLAVALDQHGRGIGRALVGALETLARAREYTTIFAVSNDGEFFNRLGYFERNIPELDRERSAVSRFKGVYAKDILPNGAHREAHA